MLENFIALEAALRAPLRVEPVAAEPSPAEDPVDLTPHPWAPFATELALARLAALEAFERAAPRLLEALARDVLARELSVAPPDLGALVRALSAEFASEEPVAFVVSREDAARFPAGIPVRVDPRLRSGDLVLEVRDGEIDARFALRVRNALENVGAR